MLRLVRVFVFGALFFSVLDGFHSHAGVLAYSHPWLALMAWWVPLEFGAMWVVVALSVPALEARLGTAAVRTSRAEVAVETVLFVVVYALTALLARDAALLVALLLALLAVRFVWFSRARDLVFVMAGAALGPLGESLVSASGSFHYRERGLGLVPIWLPLLWAHGGFFARRVFAHEWMK